MPVRALAHVHFLQDLYKADKRSSAFVFHTNRERSSPFLRPRPRRGRGCESRPEYPTFSGALSLGPRRPRAYASGDPLRSGSHLRHRVPGRPTTHCFASLEEPSPPRRALPRQRGRLSLFFWQQVEFLSSRHWHWSRLGSRVWGCSVVSKQDYQVQELFQFLKISQLILSAHIVKE